MIAFLKHFETIKNEFPVEICVDMSLSGFYSTLGCSYRSPITLRYTFVPIKEKHYYNIDGPDFLVLC